MTNGFRHDFPHLGVEIVVPEHLTIRQYNPPPMDKLKESDTFAPLRVVIDFDIFDREKGARVKTEVNLRVYFTEAEYNITEGKLKLAFWNEKLKEPDWEDLANQNIVTFGQPQWTGRGISYFGYIDAKHPDWGDPSIALGR
jgi:hypothetical protein